MEETIAVAEAVALAGLVASVLQERFFSKLQGRSAFAASVAVSLAVGIVATARTGGFVTVANAADPFGFAIAVLASAGVALAASQAAFRVFVRPITTA